MNHLIVYAHPSENSFNHAILDTVKASLEEKGHTVAVHDLYASHFSPVLTEADQKAMASGAVPEDIAEEQAAVKEADVITLIYPIWWAGMPAILKGWIDRVFSYGFAYAYEKDGTVSGLLKGKKGFIINTMGAGYEEYDKTGMLASMKQVTDESIWQFVGIEPAGHLFFGEVPSVAQTVREEMLEEVEARVKKLF